MTTNSTTTGEQALIDRLAADLGPVTPLAGWRPALAIGIAVAVALACVAAGLGVRADIVAGAPHPLAVLRSGVLLLLGAVAAAGAIAAARPGVGMAPRAWKTALAAAALFPLAALVRIVADPAGARAAMVPTSMIECLSASLVSALVLGGILTVWLRRGAPVAPERTGMLAGLAAGALGAFAYSIRCPYDDIAYTGLVYPVVIAIAAGLGRLLISPLIRW